MKIISEFETFSDSETNEIGKKLSKEAKKNDVFCLIGDLGVGKTVFAKGFAAGLGVREIVNSPTFTIVQEYQGEKLKLYHFDIYRIEAEDELYEIGFDDYIFSGGVSLIEWADRLPDIMPENAKWIEIKKMLDKGIDYRKITLYSI